MSARTLLLISPPVLHGGAWWQSRIGSRPHLYSLSGYVRDLLDVRIVELDPPGSTATLAERLAELDDHLGADTVLVGISCWTSMHYLGSVEVARHVRALAPDVPIVVGGHHPTAVPDDFEGEVDWVVVGDGEHVLRDLCETLPKRPPATEVVHGPNFDMSDPRHIDWDNYAWHGDDRVLWIALSRGCPFLCQFCMEPERGKRWSAYSVEDALTVLEGLARTHAPRIVCFTDPIFGKNRRWAHEFLTKLEQRRLPMMFWAETRADLMSPDLLDLFRACDFKVDFGLESGSPEMVRRMVKSRNPEAYLARARETFDHVNRIGLHHDIGLLFNYPGETPETVRETYQYVESLAQTSSPLAGWVSTNSYFVLPGTPIYHQLDRLEATLGAEFRHRTWWRERADHHRLATDVLPSPAWTGREADLRDFHQWQFRVNSTWVYRYAPETLMFRQRFFVGDGSPAGIGPALSGPAPA